MDVTFGNSYVHCYAGVTDRARYTLFSCFVAASIFLSVHSPAVFDEMSARICTLCLSYLDATVCLSSVAFSDHAHTHTQPIQIISRNIHLKKHIKC